MAASVEGTRRNARRTGSSKATCGTGRLAVRPGGGYVSHLYLGSTQGKEKAAETEARFRESLAAASFGSAHRFASGVVTWLSVHECGRESCFEEEEELYSTKNEGGAGPGR